MQTFTDRRAIDGPIWVSVALQPAWSLCSMDFAFLKSRYDFELQRREQQTAALAFPVGVLGGLGSVLALMARSFDWHEGGMRATFAVPLVLAIVAFVICALCLVRVYHRQTYVYLPKLAALENTARAWCDYYTSEGSSEAEARDHFAQELRQRVIAATDRNTDINDERSALLYWARVWLFATLCLTALTGVPYVANQVDHLMTERPSTPQAVPPAGYNPQATRPTPPPFPPNREIREGDIPKRDTPPSR